MRAFTRTVPALLGATLVGPALVGLAFVGQALVALPAEAQSTRCLPTCNVDDARFLAIAGANLITLSDTTLSLEIAVPAGATTFQVGFFDGDGGELDGLGASHWDTGVTAPFRYTLFADPTADGTGSTVVELLSGMPFVTSDTMPDNGWIDFPVATSAIAAAPSGNFFYRLSIELMDPSLTTLNAFKVRTSALVTGLTVDPAAQPFSYIANWTGIDDISIVYPLFPLPVPTTYDGNFSFFFDVPTTQSEVAVWDGDFDRGDFIGTNRDTDDPDTPNDVLPPWATADANFEGVATGGENPLTTGNPADNQDVLGFGIYVLREPTVAYDLLFPDGQEFTDANPSGNQEWEQFRVSTLPGDPEADAVAAVIPPGTYELRVRGVDMLNLNAVLIPFRVLCVEEDGTPCTPLRAFLVGDTVFEDRDGDGMQDDGEPGIEGVTLELRDQAGVLLATATTDADGHYTFPVDAGSYEVEVAAANFAAGGPLQGAMSTTGNERTEDVIDANVLIYDFGYRRPRPVNPGTGTIGYWKNHPEDWPVGSITLGDTTYSKSQAITLLGQPSRGDKTIDLAKQLIAAKLNVLIGNDASCIQSTIDDADDWLKSRPVGSEVSGSSSAWAVAGPLHTALDDYNNGRLCAPHRD